MNHSRIGINELSAIHLVHIFIVTGQYIRYGMLIICVRTIRNLYKIYTATPIFSRQAYSAGRTFLPGLIYIQIAVPALRNRNCELYTIRHLCYTKRQCISLFISKQFLCLVHVSPAFPIVLPYQSFITVVYFIVLHFLSACQKKWHPPHKFHLPLAKSPVFCKIERCMPYYREYAL